MKLLFGLAALDSVLLGIVILYRLHSASSDMLPALLAATLAVPVSALVALGALDAIRNKQLRFRFHIMTGVAMTSVLSLVIALFLKLNIRFENMPDDGFILGEFCVLGVLVTYVCGAAVEFLWYRENNPPRP